MPKTSSRWAQNRSFPVLGESWPLFFFCSDWETVASPIRFPPPSLEFTPPLLKMQTQVRSPSCRTRPDLLEPSWESRAKEPQADETGWWDFWAYDEGFSWACRGGSWEGDQAWWGVDEERGWEEEMEGFLWKVRKAGLLYTVNSNSFFLSFFSGYSYKDKVKDYNFGSLIRMDARDEYAETNTIFGASFFLLVDFRLRFYSLPLVTSHTDTVLCFRGPFF